MNNYSNIELLINLKEKLLELTMPYTEAIMHSVVFLICCIGLFILIRAVAPYGLYDSRKNHKTKKSINR